MDEQTGFDKLSEYLAHKNAVELLGKLKSVNMGSGWLDLMQKEWNDTQAAIQFSWDLYNKIPEDYKKFAFRKNIHNALMPNYRQFHNTNDTRR